MKEAAQGRGYRSELREAAARRTRSAILDAGRGLFVSGGYTATTVAAIAERAAVAVDTVYASVGSQPILFRLLLETAKSGTEQAEPALERDYVQRIRHATTAIDKLTIYAGALRMIQGRLAPLFSGTAGGVRLGA